MAHLRRKRGELLSEYLRRVRDARQLPSERAREERDKRIERYRDARKPKR